MDDPLHCRAYNTVGGRDKKHLLLSFLLLCFLVDLTSSEPSGHQKRGSFLDPVWTFFGPFLGHSFILTSSLFAWQLVLFFSSSPPWKAGDQQILGPPWTLVCPLWRILANSSAQQFLVLLSLQGFPHRKRVTCINPAGGREEALIVIIARYNC